MEPLGAENAWIASVKSARRHLHAWLAMVIGVVTIGLALFVTPRLYNGVQASGTDGSLSPALSQTLFYLLVFLPLYACAGFSRLWEQRAPTQAFFARWRGLALGTATGGLLFLLVVLAASIAGLLEEQPARPDEGLILGVGLALCVTAFQVFGEELFFRGWLQPLLAADWGAAIALVVTAILFAGAHCLTQVPSNIAILNIFLAGLLFGLMALRTGGLAAPFGSHWLWNGLEQSVLGLTPNPGVDPLGSFVDLDLVGPLLLSGGPDGLNGSLLVTLILLLGATAFLFAEFPKDERLKPARTQAQPQRGSRKRVR